MNKWKCGVCAFFGDYEELRISKEIDREPYGDQMVDRVSVYYHCPECDTQEVTEYAEVNW